MKRLLCLLAVMLLLVPAAAFARSDVTLEVAPLYQEDYTTPLFTWEGEEKTVASSGCGAVCLAMAMSTLSPETAPSPEELLTWAYENGKYLGAGLSCKTLVSILEAFGFTGRWIGTYPKQLRQALKDGHPVVAAMGPGLFTKRGHYILIYGIDPKDQLRVIDPNSREKSLQMYDMQMIFEQIGGTQAFLICGLTVAEETGKGSGSAEP